MKRGQIAILLVAVVAVAGTAFLGGTKGGGGGSGGDAGPVAPKGALSVSFAYSPEKEVLLKPLIARFNAQRVQVGGKPVFISGQNVASGDAETRIARGTFKPVSWSPSSSLWGRLLDFEADKPLI
ncbi:MAG: Ca-activated chloride channel, partial [Solirubrobacteraceae bacterium]|nr:Ca-activated chloride channel [Solirubrobacteraceae bacterium]